MISRDQCHTMARCGGRNPNIVFRKWRPFLLQTLLEAPVFAGHHDIAVNDGASGRELFQPGGVFGRTVRFRRTEIQFTERYRWDKHSVARSRFETTIASPLSKAMTIFVPLADINPLAFLVNRFRHLLG